MNSISSSSGRSNYSIVRPLGTIVPATRTATRTATTRPYDPRAMSLARAATYARSANDMGHRAEIIEPGENTVRINVVIDGRTVSREWSGGRGNLPSNKIRAHNHWFRYGGSFTNAEKEHYCNCAVTYQPWQLGLCGADELQYIIWGNHVPDQLVTPPEPVTNAEQCIGQYGVYYVTDLPARERCPSGCRCGQCPSGCRCWSCAISRREMSSGTHAAA